MIEINEGDITQGIVKNIKPYGAFIEIKNGETGLLHIEDISVSRIKSPKERLKIGQKINIVVKSIDRDNKRIFFSYKELFGTWEDNVKSISQGTIIKRLFQIFGNQKTKKNLTTVYLLN